MIDQPEFDGFPAPVPSDESLSEQFERVTREKGLLIPQALVADFLGVTRGRVCQLLDKGRFERFVIAGTFFVPLAQIEAHKPLSGGRPRKAA